MTDLHNRIDQRSSRDRTNSYGQGRAGRHHDGRISKGIRERLRETRCQPNESRYALV